MSKTDNDMSDEVEYAVMPKWAIILVNPYCLAIDQVIGVFDEEREALEYQIEHNEEWKGKYNSVVIEYKEKNT